MGATVCAAVAADPELELVAAVDPQKAGLDLRDAIGVDLPVRVAPEAGALADADARVAVDFTHLDAARGNLRWCAEHGVHAVVGTTGFGDADYAELAAGFTRSNCIVAPNFAVGAVLMMRFAELAAPWFETAEIIELHHDQKIDAPSGTAMTTARRVHSVRLLGLVAHQEVLLGTTGQSLSIRHDSYDRTSYMPGVLLAVKTVADHPGLTVGLDPILGV